MEPAVDIPVSGAVLVQEQRIARLGDRAVAAVLDGVILFPIFIATTALTAYLYGIPAAPNGNINLEGGPALLSMAMDTAIWCTYYFLSELLFSTTFGKEAMAIEVRSTKGGECSALESLLRNIFRPIDAFGFYIVAFLVATFSSVNQRIGDRVAGTVVREKPTARRGRAVVGLILLNVLLGYAAVSFVELAHRALQ